VRGALGHLIQYVGAGLSRPAHSLDITCPGAQIPECGNACDTRLGRGRSCV
jgi:hypothetical protein